MHTLYSLSTPPSTFCRTTTDIHIKLNNTLDKVNKVYILINDIQQWTHAENSPNTRNTVNQPNTRNTEDTHNSPNTRKTVDTIMLLCNQ